MSTPMTPPLLGIAKNDIRESAANIDGQRITRHTEVSMPFETKFVATTLGYLSIREIQGRPLGALAC